jgi:hypothetical protein
MPVEEAGDLVGVGDDPGDVGRGGERPDLQRPGAVMFPIGRQPDVTGRDIADVADQLIARWG